MNPPTIKVPGTIYVYPPRIRKRWLGLRKQEIPESVGLIGWWIEGGDLGMPTVFAVYWDLFVAAAQENETYFDYREGTDRYQALPESFKEVEG